MLSATGRWRGHLVKGRGEAGVTATSSVKFGLSDRFILDEVISPTRGIF